MIRGVVSLAYRRSQEPGGVVTAGPNLVDGYSGNAVASDIGAATIGGGGAVNYENIIGGDGSATVNTATPNAASTGTGADYSVITGGYDNVAGGLASIISGFHNYTGVGSSHGTISGGSIQAIKAGEYNTIGGGTLHAIQGGTDNSTIAGGRSNSINIAAGEDNGTIGGGQTNSVTARHGTVSGGINNTASGVGSTVAGGNNNTASGAQSAIGGGELHTSGGTGSYAAGGYNNTLSATSARSDYSAILGSYQSSIGATAAARFSGILGGRANTINAEYAAVVGGRDCSIGSVAEAAHASGYGAKATIAGQHVHASGYFSAAGDAQTSVIVARRQTTDATPAELRVNSTVGARILMPTNTTWAFTILLVARRTDVDGEQAAYEFKGLMNRDSGDPAIVGSVTKTVIAETTAAWDADVTVDTTNDAMQINVTGEAAKTINWVARVTLVEVTG